MKRIFSVVMVCLLCVSIFTIFTPKASASNYPVGYWKFDEGSGDIAADSSGNGNNGTLENGPAWVNGKYGKALSFDGVDDYVNVTENTDLNPHASNWTISAWVNIAKLSYGIYGGGFPECYGFVIACKRQSEHDSSLTLLVQGGTSATSQAKFAFVWDDFEQAGGAESTLMNVTGWHYVVGVRRDGQLFVYVDGAEFGPNNFGPPENQITPTTNISSSTPIHLAHHGAWATYYNGTIDEVRIYNRALSQQEIRTDMGPRDIAVTNMTVCYGQTACVQNRTHQVNVTATNQGQLAETFNLTLYWNTTHVIGNQSVSLAAGETRTVTINWAANQARNCRYNLSAVATPVPGEINTTHNIYIGPTIIIIYLGDVNADKSVSILDVVLITGIYGAKFPQPQYKANPDLNCDGQITILDVVLCTGNYGHRDP